MKVKIKKLHPDAVIPKYAHDSDAGLDLHCVHRGWDDYGNIVYMTGLAFEIPSGYVGLLFPRSSVCKKELSLTNSVGVIDSGYRGEVMMKFSNTENPREPYLYTEGKVYEVGERIGQLIILPYPKIEFEEATELSSSDRGEGGYGSTGQ